MSNSADATLPHAPSASPRQTLAVRSPELLSPAGDRECVVAAVENGADAVYFGLRTHNARARAHNFDLSDVPDLMKLLHKRGVRGYVTLNTLVFPSELQRVELLVRRLTAAGVDAVIVQDLGLARLIRAVSPDLEIHASTQMSITSAAGVAMARELGCSRVILARELSLREIERIRSQIDLPLEVFVHGALCVAYSGQCLTSEALGGRSANRGECAQACRMPYQVVCDGKLVDLDRVKYLLSPQDLAAFELIPRLIQIGVSSLKIEGRLKSPEYVATITRHYRHAIDAALADKPAAFSAHHVYEMEMTFSRGFSRGFLDGNNHKVLVRGDYSKKRGVYLGSVRAVQGSRVLVELAAPVKPGDGLVFDGDDSGIPEQGGRVYEVHPPARGRRLPASPASPLGFSTGLVELGFGHRDLNLRQLVPGQRIWKTDDPELSRKIRQTFQGDPHRTLALHFAVEAKTGENLRVDATTALGHHATATSPKPLSAALHRPCSEDDLREQLGRLGGTGYHLASLHASIVGQPLVPRSLLNQLRREVVHQLDEIASTVPPRAIAEDPALPTLAASLWHNAPAIRCPDLPELIVLCRNTAQVLAARNEGIRTIYLEFQHIKHYPEGIQAARSGPDHTLVYIVTPRIEKPGEANLFRFLAKQGADGLVIRNAGGLAFCASHHIPFIADFSMNAANQLTAQYLWARGAQRVTASYDLSADQLFDLLGSTPPGLIEVVIHQRMPMFLMEHCVFCAFLSPGTDKTNCGRPCDRHDVKLKDRVGIEHPLKADVGCRNTLYNAIPQTAAEFLPQLIQRLARHLRIEFLDDSPESVRQTIRLYQQALAGQRNARTLWKELRATNQYGVTRGQLAVID